MKSRPRGSRCCAGGPDVVDRRLILVLALTVLLRVPFLNQAIQGDDSFYLTGAEHAQIDPAHPHHASYVFRGKVVDMRGHPHPPLNAWTLGLLLAIFGDVEELRFHTAYLVFSLMATASVWFLAKRFTEKPLAATLLFLVTPAFVVNGTSLESDLPFLAYWLACVALFVYAVDDARGSRLGLACAAMAGAALAAYQSVLLVPILAVYLWQKRRTWWQAWVALATVPAILGGWQLYERLSTGALPATVLAGYFKTYDLQNTLAKLNSAEALTAHAGWIVFPALVVLACRNRWAQAAGLAAALAGIALDPSPLFWLPFGCGVLLIVSQRPREFLSVWILLFFAASLALFFAGSARYLLPLAAPVAIFIAQRLSWRALAWGIAAQASLSLCLAAVNYQHWDGYRQFVRSLPRPEGQSTAWVNGEWGLRFYMQSEGGLALTGGQAVRPGDIVVSSELGYPAPFTTGGGRLVPLAARQIRPRLPFRLIALHTKSAYSTASLGLRPFDVSTGPIDELRAEAVVERKPVLSLLPMNSPDADSQIASGVYQLEDNRYRWMADRAVILLKTPAKPQPLSVSFFIPANAPARRVTVETDGRIVADRTYPTPGLYKLVSAPVRPAGDTATVMIRVDRSMVPPGDQRRLGMILSEVGFGAKD